MTEYYTPTTADMRERAAQAGIWGFDRGRAAEFDRWLAEYTRIKQAEALEAFAERWATADGMEALMLATDAEEAVRATEKELLARAAEYRKGEGDE